MVVLMEGPDVTTTRGDETGPERAAAGRGRSLGPAVVSACQSKAALRERLRWPWPEGEDSSRRRRSVRPFTSRHNPVTGPWRWPFI